MKRAVGLLLLLVLFVVMVPAIEANAASLSPGDVLVVAEDAGTIHRYSGSGIDLGVFVDALNAPAWLTADRSGNVYVTEYGGNTIRKFSPIGSNLLTITTPFTPGGIAVARDGTIYVAHYDGGAVHRYSASGADLGVFASPGGNGTDFIKLDAGDNLYVADWRNAFIRKFGSNGEDLGNFVNAAGIEGMAFNSMGELYVSNNITGIIQRYSASGEDLGAFAMPGYYGLAFDSEGNLYSAASGGPIDKFSPSGSDLGGFGRGGRDVVVVAGPVNIEQCKHGSWKTFEFPRIFKNQGDCVRLLDSHVASDVDE